MADSEEQSGLISRFVNVSGVSEERARFYLESASWNLEVALESLFDHIEVEDDAAEEFQSVPEDPSPPTVQAEQKPSSYSQPPPHGSAAFPKSAAPSRFGTIGSLRGEEEGDSSDEEGQAFYAGGSERGGGQQILGPSKKSSNKIVKDMFKAAKEHGAEEVEPGASGAAAAGRSQAFQGRAYRLGDSEATSEVINSRASLPQQPQVDMILKLWKNGFSVDDGPLRDFSAPENREFLTDIKNGEVPRELIQQARGGEVNLNLEDHRHEDYVKPRTVIRAFTGEGHRLGCPSDPDPAVAARTSSQSVVSSTPAAAAAATVSSGCGFSSDSLADFDASQPSTNIQVRLADGSRLAGKFNLSHRISDIRQFIITSRPQYAASNFILMTTFPNVELTDETRTIGDAKLMNAVVVQRIK